MIGQNLDIQGLTNRLKALSSVAECSQQVTFDLVTLIKDDNRFQSVNISDDIIQFRVTGYKACGFSEEAALVLHGVNLNAMNLDLCRTFNSSSSKYFLCCVIDSTNQLYLKVAHSDVKDGYWQLLSSVANGVIERNFKHICGCKRFW